MATQLSFSELESTQSTDPSSSLSTTSTFESTRRFNVTREELKRKELLHTIELLKLELSQKNLLVETLKQEHETTVLELEEKLSDAQHEKVMFSTQLALLKRGFEEEIRQNQQRSRKEANQLNEQIRRLEEDQPKLVERIEDIKLSLQAPLMTESKYCALCDKSAEELTIEEYVMLRYYELCHEHIQRSSRLEGENQQMKKDSMDKDDEIQRLRHVRDMHVTSADHVTVEVTRVGLKWSDLR